MCVYQKGWNYFQIKFLNADVQLKSQQNIPVASGIKPYNRFYDEATSFQYDNQTNTLTFPAIRIEYFDQLIEIHKIFNFIVHTNDNYLQIQHKIYFQHFPKDIPTEAPPISQCKTKYKKCIQLNNFKIPGLQYFDQMFFDNHAARMEHTYMWMGINDTLSSGNQLLKMQDYIFLKLYQQPYLECLIKLSDAQNLHRITEQFLRVKVKNTENNIKQIQTLETLSQTYQEICQQIANQENIDLSAFENTNSSNLDENNIENIHKSIIQFVCPVTKSNHEMVFNKAIQDSPDQQNILMENSVSSKTENLDELINDEPKHPNLISQLSNQIYSERLKKDSKLTNVQQSLCDIAEKVRENVKTISSITLIKHENKLAGPTILMKYMSPFPTNYHDILNYCHKKHPKYTNLQLQLLQEQQQRVQRHITQFKIFNSIIQQAKNHFPQQQKGAQLYVFVHGYKGSQYDFKFFKGILKTKFESLALRQEIYYVVLDYAIATNTQILDLGYSMIHQLRKSIMAAVRKTTFEECIQQIEDIHFIGFSMGNIVIESLLSQIEFDYPEYESIIKFNKKYQNIKITHEKVQLILNDAEKCCRKNQLLLKLNQYYCLNGPILGATKTNGLVNVGIGFLKTFGKGNTNICLNELNVEFQSRKMFEQYKPRLRFLQEILDFDVKKKIEVTRFCKNETISELGQDGFKELCLMDVLAFNSHLGFFKNIYLFASHHDGYVRFESAIAQVSKYFQGYLLQKYMYCDNISRYVIKHDMKKFNDSSYFDKTTGRCVHLAPLTDNETIDIITNIIINNL